MILGSYTDFGSQLVEPDPNLEVPTEFSKVTESPIDFLQRWY